MPINKHMLESMQKEYGSKKGASVYFASENKGKESFKKGLKTASEEGHTAKDYSSFKSGKKHYSKKAVKGAIHG